MSTSSADRPVRIAVNISCSHGDEDEQIVEIPRDEWNALTPAQRARRCDDEAEGCARNVVNWGGTVLGDDAKDME